VSTEKTEPRNQRDLSWVPYPRPVGLTRLPEWVKDIHVDWHDGFSNGPSYWLRVTHDIGDWPGKVWRKEGDYYRAYNPDGYIEQHCHNGRVTPTLVKAWRNPDGTLCQYRGDEGGAWVEEMFNATTQQEGYAKRHFWLKMEDGSDLVLRGPWSTGCPEGYSPASIVIPKYIHGAPWFKRCTPLFGLAFKHELLAAIFARFQAHLPLALVTQHKWTSLEPYREEWGMPKGARIAEQVTA